MDIHLIYEEIMKQRCGIRNPKNKLISFDPPTFEQLKEGVSVGAKCLGYSMLCFDDHQFLPINSNISKWL